MHFRRLVSGILVSGATGFILGAWVWAPVVIAGHAHAHGQAEDLLLQAPVNDAASYPASKLQPNLEASPVDRHARQKAARASDPKEVPEPATVVSLAGLAAMAGISLLLRVRWFRRS